MKWKKKTKTSHPMWRRWSQLRVWIRNATPTKYTSYYGVKMDPNWDNDFWNFSDYIDSHWNISSLSQDDIFDRIDNTKPYEPGNVRFTDRQGNARNRRSTRFITYKGKTKSLAEWAEEFNTQSCVIHTRLELGWTIKQALTGGYYGKT